MLTLHEKIVIFVRLRNPARFFCIEVNNQSVQPVCILNFEGE